MDKFQVYRTGVDAVMFLLSNKETLGLTHENVLELGEVFEHISEEMSNCVFALTGEDHVSA